MANQGSDGERLVSSDQLLHSRDIFICPRCLHTNFWRSFREHRSSLQEPIDNAFYLLSWGAKPGFLLQAIELDELTPNLVNTGRLILNIHTFLKMSLSVVQLVACSHTQPVIG